MSNGKCYSFQVFYGSKIACLSPADFHALENISTLNYATKATYISNKPIVNEDPRTVVINSLKVKPPPASLSLFVERSHQPKERAYKGLQPYKHPDRDRQPKRPVAAVPAMRQLKHRGKPLTRPDGAKTWDCTVI